jgi:hypothetical protein
MDKLVLLTFDEHLHDISPVGSHRMIAVPNATDEEVLKVITEGGVTVWNDWYITKSMRLLKEAGYEPIMLESAIVVHPHDEPAIVNVNNGGFEVPENPKMAGLAEESIDEFELDRMLEGLKDNNDMNRFASFKLGYEVEFAESTSYTAEEIEEVVEKNPGQDMIAHVTMLDDEVTAVTLITTEYPEYKPWGLLVEDIDKEEVKTLMFFDEE